MTSLVLIPWGATDWSIAGRLNARTPLPLNRDGRRVAVRWANELASRELAAVYCGGEKAAVQTAEVVATRSEVPRRGLDDLNEVDIGLWEGLTEMQIRDRFPRLYKRWEEQPDRVCPPDGENLAQAADRLREAIARIAHKHKNDTVGVVLGPLSYALARCSLERRNFGELRVLKPGGPVWYELEPAARPRSR
jgi:probable phosphoglycerate mutase